VPPAFSPDLTKSYTGASTAKIALHYIITAYLFIYKNTQFTIAGFYSHRNKKARVLPLASHGKTVITAIKANGYWKVIMPHTKQ
jgi:hypothetical protein